MSAFRSTLLGAALLLSHASAGSLTLQRGQTGQLGERRITVISVQDNRCPAGVVCIREGELIARVLVTQGRAARFLTLEWPAAAGAPWAGVRIRSATTHSATDRSPVVITFTDER